MNIEIKELSKDKYKGKPFVLKYKTGGYYHIEVREDGFGFSYQKYAAEKELSFTDNFFDDWLDEPVGFGAFDNGSLVGYVEGTHEK